MGGFGSGRFRAKREVTDSSITLSIFDFKRSGLLTRLLDPWSLTGGEGGRLTCQTSTKARNRFGQVFGAIGIYVEAEAPGNVRLALAYRHNGEPIIAPLVLASTLPHLGGVRHWFLCPGPKCRRRVGKIYMGAHGRFGCRQCLGLTYLSAQTRHPVYSRLLALEEGRGKGAERWLADYYAKCYGKVRAEIERKSPQLKFT